MEGIAGRTQDIQAREEQSFLRLSGTKQREKAKRIEEMFTQVVGDEDVSLRGENVKHYDLGANRRQAVVFSEAVHYRESEEEPWREIDNTLEETVNAQGRAVLRNRANRVHVEFPQRADGGSLAAITANGRTLAWRFEEETRPVRASVRSGAELKQARLVEQAKKLGKYAGRTEESLKAADLAAELESAQERRSDIAALKAENTYAEILPGVSVRYTLHGMRVKEDIILAEAGALKRAAIRLPKEYEYDVTVKGELLAQDRQTGAILFSMDAPVVYDAEGRKTVAGVTLTDCGSYTRMEYEIEEGYLAEAAYPVTIDPVINSSAASTNIHDTTICRGYNFGRPNDAYMMIGKYNGVSDMLAMLKFRQLAKLTASDTVISAVLNVAPKSAPPTNYIAAYEILRPWDVGTVTWNNFNPDDTSYVAAEALACVAGSSTNWLSFDLTNLYRKWCTKTNGVSNNNGVAFRTPANIGGANYSEVYSSESAYPPVMYVNYVSHAGIEGWWQYESMGAGRAGTVYTDLFNGNMVLAHRDTVMTGNRNPVSVSHYYNSCLSHKNDYNCGYGWKTDAHQKVEWRVHNNRQYFVWVDGDGTEHFFEVTGSQPYSDSEGMELKLTYNSANAADRYILIEDKGNNQMRFRVVQDYLAWLVWTKDASGNTTNYAYVSGYEAAGRIDTITDPAASAGSLPPCAAAIPPRACSPARSRTS